MASGTLVIGAPDPFQAVTTAIKYVSCSETDPRIDPSRYINLSANGNRTSVVKTAGGRTQEAINSIHQIDQASQIGMIVVVEHIGCPWAPGDCESNVRDDISVLKNSPYVRKEIPVIGYVLDGQTGELKEVSVQRNAPDEETRRKVLSELEDFGPFWS